MDPMTIWMSRLVGGSIQTKITLRSGELGHSRCGLRSEVSVTPGPPWNSQFAPENGQRAPQGKPWPSNHWNFQGETHSLASFQGAPAKWWQRKTILSYWVLVTFQGRTVKLWTGGYILFPCFERSDWQVCNDRLNWLFSDEMGSSLFVFYRQIFCSFWGKVPYQALVVSIAGFTGSMLAKFKHITVNGTRIDASHSIQYDIRCSCKSCCWCLQFTITARGSDPIWRILFEQTGWILPRYGSQDYESIRHPNIQGSHPPWSGKANPLNPYDVDASEIPNKHLRCINLVDNGINYQPQLVPGFFHQQYL